MSRDYGEIEKTVASFLDLGDDVDAGLHGWLEHLAELGELGIEHVIVAPRGPWMWRRWMRWAQSYLRPTPSRRSRSRSSMQGGI